MIINNEREREREIIEKVYSRKENMGNVAACSGWVLRWGHNGRGGKGQGRQRKKMNCKFLRNEDIPKSTCE